MHSELPFTFESVGWNDLSQADRSFFCIQDEYLPLPPEHAAQIKRLTPEVARRLWQWLEPSLPTGWPESEPHFANQTILRLEDRSWNTDDGVQTVRQWLHDRGIPYSTDVFLVYEAHQIIQMPWKLLVKYWDALAWSVGYSMIALDRTRQWACCFHHEDVIVFGAFSDKRARSNG
jgi:hypothetical protein